MTARVSMLLKWRASPVMLPFSLFNKKRLAIQHMNRALFPAALSIPPYDIGKYVGLRTYQHPLVQTRRQIYYQHDRASSDFSHVFRQYLNHKFPNRWIGLGRAQNWPPWSPDLNPSDYHVWCYMKDMVCAHKVNMREELLQQILSVARSINNAAMLRKVTSSLVTRVRKYIQADGGHFEQLA